MNTPRFSYSAINELALMDTGHFCYLDAWSINALLSIMSQSSMLYLWENDQFPLTQPEIDDLENKLAKTQGQLMSALVGMIMPVCTDTLPEGTLLCDGSTYLRVDYPNLYDRIDPGYHIDADSFIVPDLRDRFVLGSSASHVNNSTGGSFDHTQTVGEMPTHSHTTDPHSHSEVIAVPTIVTVGLELPTGSAVPGAGITGLATVVVHNAGGGAAMDITPPFIALRYVVVAL